MSNVANTESGWHSYRDLRFGFQVAFPNGWTIHADEHAIHIASGDGKAFALVVPFAGRIDDDNRVAQTIHLLASLPQIPQAQLQRLAPPTQPGSDAVGEFTYQSAGERGLGRLLFSQRQGGLDGGMFFFIAAPMSRFENEKATLPRILGSLVFGGGPAPQTESGHMDEAAFEQAVMEAQQRMEWVAWSDPKENAFHVEIPRGWIVDGGALRYGLTDVRSVLHLRSPDGDIVVQIGDPNLPLFTIPTPLHFQMGIREGQLFMPTNTFQSILAGYMPPRMFGRWYLANCLGGEIEGAVPTLETDQVESSQQHTAQLRQAGVPAQVEISMTEFTARSKRTGKPVAGLLVSHLTGFGGQSMGGGAWSARPTWSIVTDGDGATESRKAVVVAVIMHANQTWQDDPEWTTRSNQQQAQITQQQNQANRQISQQLHETAMDNIRQAGERSRTIAQQSDDRRRATMNSYWQRRNAQDNVQRRFVNYLGDRTDVYDPNSGQAWNVGSGHSHYYRDDRNDTVIGTDSAYSPGVDWTPLNEL